MKIYLIKYFFSNILRKKCNATVPRSGEDGEAVNCFNVYLYSDNKPFMVILNISKNGIAGKLYTENGFQDEVSLSFKETKEYNIKITHHYGLYDTKYDGLLDYALTGFTKIDSLKCIIYKVWNNSKQFIFNKRRLATKDRIEILRALIDMQFSGNGSKFMTMDLMTHLYSLRWIVHPENDSKEHKLQLFVDSFVESGELNS